MVAGFWVWWPAFGWLGCYGFLVGTWWVLFCFIYLFIYFYFGFLVLVGFCQAEGSGGMVGMVVAWWALFVQLWPVLEVEIVQFWCLFDLGDLLVVILLGMGLLEVEGEREKNEEKKRNSRKKD